MKANHHKCHLLLNGKNLVTMNISGIDIKNTECEELLGIKVDCELKYKKASKSSIKANVLSRITLSMSLAKKILLTISFFNYAIWIFTRSHDKQSDKPLT